MLTEKEAWELLARACEDRTEEDAYIRLEDCQNCVGLCVAVSNLFKKELINIDTLMDMKMINGVPTNDLGYCWPLTFEGRLHRGKFCEEQIRNLSRVLES